jgi:hypothetical protein
MEGERRGGGEEGKEGKDVQTMKRNEDDERRALNFEIGSGSGSVAMSSELGGGCLL